MRSGYKKTSYHVWRWTTSGLLPDSNLTFYPKFTEPVVSHMCAVMCPNVATTWRWLLREFQRGTKTKQWSKVIHTDTARFPGFLVSKEQLIRPLSLHNQESIPTLNLLAWHKLSGGSRVGILVSSTARLRRHVTFWRWDHGRWKEH